MRPSVFRLSFLTALVSFGLYAGACGGDENPSSGAGGGGGTGEIAVIYEGEATDEALEALLAAQPAAVPTKYALISTPAEGASVSRTSPPTFAWSVVDAKVGGLGPAEQPARSPFPAPSGVQQASDPLEPVRALLGPLRDARAHGAPVNGNAYLLMIESLAKPELVRVFTTKTTYKPDADTWSKITAEDGPFSAWVLTGIFDENRVAADGGPFAGPWTAFNIEE
jgi:hypothetical protein